MDMSSIKDVRANKGGVVRVSLPVEVAYNLDKFQTAVKDLAERIGHPQCLSGLDFFFEQEMRFRINPQTLKAESMPGETF